MVLAALPAIIGTIAGLIALKFGGIWIGLFVFLGAILLFGGASLTFLAVLSTPVWIAIIVLGLFLVTRKK